MLFIERNVPSSKNSRVNTRHGSFTGPAVKKYLRSYGIQAFNTSKKNKGITEYKTIPMTFPVDELRELFKGKTFPVYVSFHFVRKTRGIWDFGNITQILLDLMTACGAIPDDNMHFTVPECMIKDGKHFSHDKDNPGVWIAVRELKTS